MRPTHTPAQVDAPADTTAPAVVAPAAAPGTGTGTGTGAAAPTGASSTLARWNAQLPCPLSQHTLVYLLSGAMARASSATITSPLDSVKVRVQFSQRAAEQAGVARYSGAREAARAMWKLEGPPAFFRGLPVRLLYIVPAASVSFVFYEQFRALYHRPEPSARQGQQQSRWVVGVPLILGALARMGGTALRVPFDVIRQRMQIQGSLPSRMEQLARPASERTVPGVYASSTEALRGVTQREGGVRALWAGLGATILRDIPFGVVYFFAYEHSKTVQQRWIDERSNRARAKEHERQAASALLPHPPAVSGVIVGGSLPALDREEVRAAGLSTPRYMLSGAFAAACAVAVTMPLDVIKVRLQTQGSLPPELRYKGIVDCAMSVARTEGVRGFVRGFVPRVCYLAPASAITFSLYELYKRNLTRIFDF